VEDDVRRGVAVVLLVSGILLAGWVTTTVSTAAEQPTTTPSEPADQPGEPLDLGVAPLALLAPATAGAGDRPAFSWEAVEGAASYALAILTVEDEPIWAWTGTVTEVILGGWSAPPSPEAFGPLLQGEAKWFVVAFDASGLPIANSVLRPVAP
jgi:hypothetical protein